MNRFAALLVAALVMLPLGASALALPEQVARDLPELHLAGEGRLRWFGLHIYDASLWVRGENWSADQEFALDIRYARNVKAGKLIETSLEEMRRLGFGDERRLDEWGRQMASVFPDVRKGEHLTGVNRPRKGVEFYHRGRSVGLIGDLEFAIAFFAIWLDPRTREPELRQSLTGTK